MAAVLTYAIGDIHGSYTKLANLLRHCNDHCGGNDRPLRVPRRLCRPRQAQPRGGDAADRDAGGRARPGRLPQGQSRGHAARRRQAARTRRCGSTTAATRRSQSYGVEPRRRHSGRASRLVREACRSPISDEQRFFVHAGIMPGIPLEQQRKDVLLWIREPFLSDESDHGLLHRARPHADRHRDAGAAATTGSTSTRCAWYGNPLIAAVFDERRVGPLAFIADDGSVTAAAPDQCARAGDCTVQESEHARVERARTIDRRITSAARRRRAPSRPGGGRWCCRWCRCTRTGADLAEVVIEAFDAHRPVAGERMFDAAAGDPADLGLVDGQCDRWPGASLSNQLGLDAAERRAAGDVEQRRAHRDAEAPANRREPTDAGCEASSGQRTEVRGVGRLTLFFRPVQLPSTSMP